MSEKIDLLLLIVCGILCQGIIAASSDVDILAEESSDILVREKRVIDLDRLGDTSIPIEQVNYMTIIKENNRAHCAGAILSVHNVITAASCVSLFPRNMYQVTSNSAFAHWGVLHNVTSKVTTQGNAPYHSIDGIALITVYPPFTFGPKTGNILFYTGNLRTGTEVTVTGWGCSYPLLTPRGTQRKLRQINIPIMDHRECANVFRGLLVINHKYICTSHPRKYCAYSDLGAPLVVNNMLAGIHVLKPDISNRLNPDVFIDLQLPEYSVWIRQNILFE